MTTTRRTLAWTLLAAGALAVPAALAAQDATLEAGLDVAAIRFDPATVSVEVGGTTPLSITAVDASGQPVEAVLRIRGQGVSWDRGVLRGDEAGETTLVVSVTVPAGSGVDPVRASLPITVRLPRVARVEVTGEPDVRLYAGTSVRYQARAVLANGSVRDDAPVTWRTSDAAVASVDGRGNVTATAPGRVTLSATVDGVEGTAPLTVGALPATRLEIRGGSSRARQGDVVAFDAVLTGPAGAVSDAAVEWSVAFVPDDSIHAPGASGIVRDGRFVGETPGHYTVFATAGELVDRRVVDVGPRGAVRPVELVGQGAVHDQHTSDLWVFEGVDGRDYAVTGTWGAAGWAYFWDVTDPGNVVKTDSIHVDARTVNDVKVSPDGRYAALSREGASTRTNGVVILDLADPAHPRIASTFESNGVTGGVHNMFATDDHLFALANGDKYVIIDVTDLSAPRYVSEYNHPNSRVHDVWVHDGIAYSSEWGNGVVVVDVGNGRWGGSIENPVFVTNVPYPVGRTHAAFPYFQESTGKFYLFLGDEIMNRNGAAWSGAGLGDGQPDVTSGYIHVIDFTDPENPEDVARYEAKEFGSHNLWVEDDVLYVAYYDGGVRVVDVSGELLGNLATQGREMSVFKAFDPDGVVPNASMAWGPQPYKGHVFFSDHNSGLWAVKVQPTTRPVS
ncbi:MAG: Ig-like domain-containing protein [Longimicrobiales bacterium]